MTSPLHLVPSHSRFGTLPVIGPCETDHIREDVPCPILRPPIAQPMLRATEHILVYLQDAESAEPLAYFQDDYRVAWLCVLFAARAINDPCGYAFWHYYGRTWQRLVPFFVERAEKHRRMAIPDFDPSFAVSGEAGTKTMDSPPSGGVPELTGLAGAGPVSNKIAATPAAKGAATDKQTALSVTAPPPRKKVA